MHYGLQLAFPSAEVLCAFEINEVANSVYEHNFGKRPKQVFHMLRKLHTTFPRTLQFHSRPLQGWPVEVMQISE